MLIVFYISGHGFGHASRCIELINVIVDRDPSLPIVVRSQVAPWLFARTARAGVRLEVVECDTGIAQIDSLHLDEAATIARAREFMAGIGRRVDTEGEWLRQSGASMVVADLPPLGIAAAHAAGLPAIALGNFTWDWIYAGYAGGAGVSQDIGRIYSNTALALRLPMWGGFETMPSVRDIPFIARRSARDPTDVRKAFGLPVDERLVLLSFGGYGLDRIDLEALSRLEGYRAIIGTSVPVGQNGSPIATPSGGSVIAFDETAMYERGYRYEDLVRAVDVVVTKPGYGIIAECLANQTALLYTSRGHFVEYDVLVRSMPRFLRCAFIGHRDLFSGKWSAHLDQLLAQPAPPEQPAVNGTDVGADMLLGLLK
jgi:hypothetical protein